MPSFPDLNEADIRQWVGSGSMDRGRGYFRQGTIRHPRREGMTLKAQCLGSRPQPYRVEVALGEEGIVSDRCSCPIGGGCKHVAALLLTWLHDPDTFGESEALETMLAARTKESLISLILKMVARHPDLEKLLEIPVPGGAHKPLDPEVIRRQISSAFSYDYDSDWDSDGGDTDVLEDMVETGREYAGQGDWRNAASIYKTVAKEILDHYESIDDESGEMSQIVYDCVEGLGECLAGTDSPEQREAYLLALFDVFRWDVDFGGIGMGDRVPEIIAEQATPDEREQVARWARDALPSGGDSWHRDYHRRTYGGFLLDLMREDLDDETFLHICRETGRIADLVDRLLERERIDEATEETRDADDQNFLSLVSAFTRHGHPELAQSLVRERVQASPSDPLIAWLKERARERGDLNEALELAQRLFGPRPLLSGYQEIKELAEGLGRWEEIQPPLLERLGEMNHYALLTQIHLEEGDVYQAIEAVDALTGARQTPGWMGGWHADPMTIEVAKAAEESYPREAIRLYMDAVYKCIHGRTRDLYAQAATYLLRVRELYYRLNEKEAWQTLFISIRDQKPNLPALKDELKRAGL